LFYWALIAKADDQAAEGVADNYSDSRCVNYVRYVCAAYFSCVHCLRLVLFCVLSCVRCVKWKLRFTLTPKRRTPCSAVYSLYDLCGFFLGIARCIFPPRP